MSSDHFIEFRNVSFAYGERPILKNISLTIPRGKLVAIMGGSGSGKTTMLRLIAGQIPPSAGQVLVDGRDVAAMNHAELFEHRRRMGMLFQFGALFTDLSVGDNVAFPIREHTRLPESMIHDLVIMKLAAVGLRGTQALMPAELSGGMARRVALARAIALDPQLMLYDEPFTGLDPISLGVIAHLIKKLNDALGTTSIMVTHDVHKSLDIVDYVYFVSNGEIVADGTPEDIRSSPSPWVHQFMWGEADGPVHFAYPASTSLQQDLGLKGSQHD
ncbi:ABC transporter ATP-binding protein [Aquitalea pelogenes]|uniref:ABC transporter ATP-binding protein n=1 Tax=Aquitalea pelogenes TaxID=1293573 RepID=UPI0007869963|nr:ABC transporter ATP-binding protein [Aquitalea pelogenes]